MYGLMAVAGVGVSMLVMIGLMHAGKVANWMWLSR